MRKAVNNKVITKWDELIQDAQRQIETGRLRIAALRKAIRNLEELRDSGQPWIGQKEANSCADH